MIKRWQVYALCSGFLIAICGQAQAEDEIVALDEVVVTATKT